jgi:inward rectifier potassium channel
MANSSYPRSLRTIENTGFSANSAIEGSRLIDRDGNPRLRKTGIPFYERISIYHSLLRMRRTKFIFLVIAFYASVNMFFAMLYYLIGVQHLSGTEKAATEIDKFLEAFFFIAQSLKKIGYCRVSPVGIINKKKYTHE